jgi:hypothetical protein
MNAPAPSPTRGFASSNRRPLHIARRLAQESAAAAVTVSTYRAIPAVPQALRMFHG